MRPLCTLPELDYVGFERLCSAATTAIDDAFDNFRREIEGATNPWSSMLDLRFPAGMLRPYGMEEGETLSRTPLVDMVDRGDRYNLRLEVPGIDKDNIQLNATEDAIEISGEQSEEESNEDKGHNYIYNERSYKSFYRSIPIPEEILPSKITARMNNGILQIEIPKKDPRRPVWEKYKNRNTIIADE